MIYNMIWKPEHFLQGSLRLYATLCKEIHSVLSEPYYIMDSRRGKQETADESESY